ncbi:hypothetical protein DPMN_045281 [Dreissena polymorpha]|uniref:Uncharacterized protein n=1 Tax=Dreissena polymorpha TaxID=45954 RepID=A0A9D4D5T2_DREPO|nr:hypothetical protein DPMN_045281 [Dreissena polymorpha]
MFGDSACISILQAEVEKAVRSKKEGSYPGFYRVPSELIKHGEEATIAAEGLGGEEVA